MFPPQDNYNLRNKLSHFSCKNIIIKNNNSKKKLNKQKLYNHGERLENICQLRNNLNANLFSHYLIDSPLCQKCLLDVEDSKHYFFIVQSMPPQRQSLFRYMNDDIIRNTNKNLLFGSEI